MSYNNNYKKWCDTYIIFFDNYIKNEKIIDSCAITFLSNMLKRTDKAIIYRIFKNYIVNEFDFIYNNNEKIYNKYIFYNEKNIDNFLINELKKKKKFKLNKINCTVLNLIIDDANNEQIIYYNTIIDTIKEINNLNK
tara:strand:+ start:1263 stop:1673 length:411 start_codon:yes stop_codon:yes gene_type:complete